jgi:hypothetical protein
MIHDDIAPQPGWLDIMLHIMDREKVDVLSAIVPQKTMQGFTSTAFGTGALGCQLKRLTMKEAYAGPATIKSADLLVNTGLMLVDMRKPWVEKVCFKFEDDIAKVDGKYVPVEISEDWYFSREARAYGAKLAATREIGVKHFGRAAYVNTQPWGSAETDNVK